MNTETDEIIIDKEFQDLIPPLSLEEYASLEASIVENNFDPAYPIILWNNRIIDGYNRYEICKKHGIKFTTVNKEFDKREAVLSWMYNNQLSRRNIDNLQKTYIVGMLYKTEKKNNGGYRKSVPQNKEVKSTAQIIAERYKMSHATVERAEKVADNINTIAESAGESPYQTLSLLNRETKITFKHIDKVVKLKPEIQKKLICTLREKRDINVDKVIREFSIEGGGPIEKAVTKTQTAQPEKNEHGVYSLIPEPVTSLFVNVKEDNLYVLNGELHCVVSINNTDFDCLITPVTGEENHFFFKLPNFKYMIMDYSAIFPSMLPIVVNSSANQEYFTCFTTFPDKEWNAFVKSHFAQLPQREQENVSPFILYVSKKDLGVLEEFINHDLLIAEQCHAIPKEQEFTELWDNRKQELIFAFKGEWNSEEIIKTVEEKINACLDAEEPTVIDISKTEVKEWN